MLALAHQHNLLALALTMVSALTVQEVMMETDLGDKEQGDKERKLPGRLRQLRKEWAASNPRVADALARWTAAVEREAESVISPAVNEVVQRSLDNWKGELPPLSRAWVNA